MIASILLVTAYTILASFVTILLSYFTACELESALARSVNIVSSWVMIISTLGFVLILALAPWLKGVTL